MLLQYGYIRIAPKDVLGIIGFLFEGEGHRQNIRIKECRDNIELWLGDSSNRNVACFFEEEDDKYFYEEERGWVDRSLQLYAESSPDHQNRWSIFEPWEDQSPGSLSGPGSQEENQCGCEE